MWYTHFDLCYLVASCISSSQDFALPNAMTTRFWGQHCGKGNM
uniref:Uncharacterized protein n=1 Tax=Aegilops tauschii subsp. strangulata TaxID=200361 RepID=A0A453IA70_AEGTS